ncbi:GAF and HD-GYP domain-containing protein [Massilia yuzhufengensis]|uniref:HD-GYP domain, c-di-GMP phosphodiesterase class II (Or its inactivated variant) n=1 Tax=Massilia yuzhufengensis TaxID=1164594 RepID=A0A1I1NF45_9BURK|nr:HD family phosphohydrolase [Massilia yuzhufengensis]SFC96239.1 HD-GYP domain, c-di-GMP phosphodiesterase class II (or its inactivated variant) [Massilia yuzhufengensis]
MQELNPTQIAQRLHQLTEVSVALGDVHDTAALLDRILLVAKQMTDADGGTLYRPSEDGRSLCFHISLNDTLGIHQGGVSGAPIDIAPVPLYDSYGNKNLASVAAYAANFNQSVNIEDVYKADVFNFSGMRSFDATFGYLSQSILTVPMTDHEGELVGVLQLVNAKDRRSGPGAGTIRAFSQTDQRFIEALSAQAAMALTNQRLIQQLENLLESLVNLINIGIDEKSPYTGRHCQFVPELTMMLAEAVHATGTGPLARFRMTDADRRELWLAGLLHDCGKITTPVHVVDKSTKLETIFDRIHLVDTRFEVLLRDCEIRALREKCLPGANIAAIDDRLGSELARIRADRDFLRRANVGGEGMSPEDQERVRRIGQLRWTGPDGQEQAFLSEDELLNLTVRFGTLTEDERKIINNHIDVTVRMLESLPWPKHLKNVPEYAGGHHERMDGKGYPKGLTREQMSVQARIMAIADIFEALTAADRPYKKGKKLSESLQILGKFALNGHIDPDLFDIFVRNRVYLQFAHKNMDAHQIDEVDEAAIPGYRP